MTEDGYVAELTVDGRGWVLWTPRGEFIRDHNGHPIVWPSEQTLECAMEFSREGVGMCVNCGEARGRADRTDGLCDACAAEKRQKVSYRDRQHKGYRNRER